MADISNEPLSSTFMDQHGDTVGNLDEQLKPIPIKFLGIKKAVI